MRLIRRNMLAVLLFVAAPATAWAGVLYDGSGDPATAGFEYFGSSLRDYVFTLDNEAGGLSGFLLQNGNVDEDGKYRLTSATELDRTAGWSIETRLGGIPAANTSNGNGFGAILVTRDNADGWIININPLFISVTPNVGFGGNPGSYPAASKYSVDMHQIHTVKLEMPAGGVGSGALKVYVDGVDTGLDTANSLIAGETGSHFFFGDDGGMDQRLFYDYIAINSASPAVPLAEIAVSSPVNATVIKGGMATLGFNLTNSASFGSQNLTTTSITPPELAGTSYGGISNVFNLPPGSNTGNIPLMATTSESTPAGAHVLPPTITGNANNSPFTPIVDDSPTLTVLDHSNGSFSETSDVNGLTIDFGKRVQGSGSQPGGYEAIPFDVFNLVNTQDFTARLELYAANVMAAGDASTLFAWDGDSLPEFLGLGAGEAVELFGVLDTNVAVGTYSATWTLGVEDHNAFNGHVANAVPLTLTLKGEIVLAVPGDVNFDGFVDIFDVNLVSAHWGTTGPTGDANGDMMVDIFDVNLISANWSPPGGATAVPEPGSAALAISLLLGLAGAATVRVGRRRRLTG